MEKINKKFGIFIIVGLFLLSSIASTSFAAVNQNQQQQQQQQSEDLVLLWKTYFEETSEEREHIFATHVNNDDVKDIIAYRHALDGATGDLLWTAEAGEGIVVGMGDINNDESDEIFVYKDVCGHDESLRFYCVDSSNGSTIWMKLIDSRWCFSVSVGNVYGNSNNEVIVGVGDSPGRQNDYVYCLDGITGDTIWRKHTGDYVLCTAINDVNADGLNEVIAGTRACDPHIYCLDGYGDVIWEFDADENEGYGYYQFIGIGNLNSDQYKEIIVGSNPGEGFENDGEFGIRCLSGFDGSTHWTWYQDWVGGIKGSFKSVIIADLIDDSPYNEVIVVGFCGIFCLSSEGIQLWYGGGGLVAAVDVGDLDADGDLDVVGQSGNIRAVSGQDGSLLWTYGNCGNNGQNSIICVDLVGNSNPEVVAVSDKIDNRAVHALKIINSAPYAPSINGPNQGDAGEEYYYTFVSTDPDGDDIASYTIDWDDGNIEVIEGPFESGSEITISHTWEETGIYAIKAKAKDISGAESDWGYKSVTMPYYYYQNSQSQQSSSRYSSSSSSFSISIDQTQSQNSQPNNR